MFHRLDQRLRFLTVVILAAAALLTGGRWWHQRRLLDHYRQGIAALDRNQFFRLETHLDALRKRSGGEQYLHLLQGGLLLRKSEYDAALREFAQLAPEGEIRYHALLLTGDCLYQLGRIEDAAGLFRLLAQENPADGRARRWLSAVYYDEGDLDAALRELQILSELRPHDFSPYRMMGLIHHQDLHNQPIAALHYRNALDRSPPPAERNQILLELGQSLIEQGEYQEGLNVLNETARDALVLSLQAHCQWQLQNHEQAWRLLDEALSVSPDEREGLILHSRMLVDAGRTQEATLPLLRILDHDQHDFPCLYQLALVYARLGNYCESENLMRRMHRSKEYRTRLAELFIQARRLDDAAIKDEIAELCLENSQPELAANWREAAAVSRRADSQDTLGPDWISELMTNQ